MDGTFLNIPFLLQQRGLAVLSKISEEEHTGLTTKFWERRQKQNNSFRYYVFFSCLAIS